MYYFTTAKAVGTCGTAEGITPVHEFKCDAAIKDVSEETNASFNRVLKCKRIVTFTYFRVLCKDFGVSVEDVLCEVNPDKVDKSVLEIDFEDELAEGKTLESVIRDILSETSPEHYSFGAFIRCCQLLGLEPIDAYRKYSYDGGEDYIN